MSDNKKALLDGRAFCCDIFDFTSSLNIEQCPTRLMHTHPHHGHSHRDIFAVILHNVDQDKGWHPRLSRQILPEWVFSAKNCTDAPQKTICPTERFRITSNQRPLSYLRTEDTCLESARIVDVINNRLSNAIKYTFPGGAVRIQCSLNDGAVVTRVADTGQGLSGSDLDSLFTSFKKLSARPTGGESSTGLGLSIVKKIVELHGGRVWVESELGKGATFSFSLAVSSANLS